MSFNLLQFTDILSDEICNSQPISLPSSNVSEDERTIYKTTQRQRPAKYTGQHGEYRSIEEIDPKYRSVFSHRYFNLVQSRVIDDALYSDKSMVVCAPTGSGKTVIFEMAIVQLLMELEEKGIDGDFKIIYMAPVKSLCTERVTEWYPKFTKLGHLCIEVTGDTDVEYHQLKPYRIIITTPEKWNMFTRRWPDHRGLVGLIKLFLIDEVHILNDDMRGPVLEAVVSRMKTIEASVQSEHRQNLLKLEQDPLYSDVVVNDPAPRIRFVAVSATVSNPEDVTAWLSTAESPAIFYKFGDECRPVKVRRIVEGYPCYEGTSIFKFDIILSYKLWPMIQKYHNGKPTLIFCNTRKSVTMTAETLSRELTVSFSPEQKAKLTALASTIKNKKLQALVLAGVGCHHAGLLFEERVNIENSFRNRDLPILITTTTLAMGVNLPAHLVIIKNTQQYVNGAYQGDWGQVLDAEEEHSVLDSGHNYVMKEYSISTILQMVGRAGRPQFDTEATAVIMTTLKDKHRYQALVEGSEPLQSYLHKRIAENLNSEAALGTVGDVAQCVQWLRSTFLYVRAGKDPRRYLGLPHNAPIQQITNKMEELCVKAMNGLASAGLITMDESSCITSTEAGRLMSIYYIDLETMKLIMKIDGTETLDKMLYVICECHELSDMHLRMDERRLLNTLNRNNKAKTIRFPMKGKITTRQMKLSCVIQAVLGCLPIQDPSLNQEAMKIMRIADRICKCIVAYVTRPESISQKPNFFSAVLNSIVLAKCIRAHLWENSPYVSKQLKGIGPTFSTLLASAGKTSFMLLEESHPRDLERIINKGAPAGNILRKQASLLPKYHLTATPSDSNTVTIKLSLLNSAFLSENMEHLTAGIHHKCFIIIGDSNNKLLLFTSFQDKDLIDVYDGTMTYSVTRPYYFEHKILAHCISTEYVGIDAQCDYVFRELEPLCIPQTKYGMSCNQPEILRDSMRNLIQPSIADIYKERKRKNNTVVTESKEKKKRDCDLIEKFKVLKENFGIASNEFRNNIHKSTKETNLLMQELTCKDKNAPKSLEQESRDFQYNNFTEHTDLDLFDLPEVNLEDMEDESINNEEVDSILNEIEKEINTNIRTADKNQIKDSSNGSRLFESYFYSDDDDNSFKRNIAVKDSGNLTHHPVLNKSRKHINNKSNYSFIDDIEKKNSLDIDLMDTDLHSKNVHSGLPDDIKVHIKKYLQNQAKVQVNKDSDIINLTIDPIDWNLDKNKTQQKSLGSKETIEIRDINNSAHRDMDQKIEKEHENLKNTPLDKEHAWAKEEMSEGTHKKHDSPNVALSKNESNAEASKIVKYHSDDDFIILSDCEEDISDLATQKVLPLSLDSDHESCYEHIELDNICMNFQDTSTDQSKNKMLIYNSPPKSNEVMNSSNNDKNLAMCTNSSYAKSMSDLGRNIYIKNSPTEQKCTKEQHSYYNSYSNSSSKKNPYVKGYQYSWTDISVLTKTMPDRQVSMIKKVTVDVNVTEISTNTNELEEGNSTQSALLPALAQEFNNEFKIHQPQPNYNLNKPSISDKAFDRAEFSAKKQVAINNRNSSSESLGLIQTSLITNNDFPAKYCLHTMKNEIFEVNSNELNKVENSGNELYPGSVSTSSEMMKSYPIQVTCTKRTKNKFVCPLKVNYRNDVQCNDSRNNNFDAKDNSIDKAIDQHANTKKVKSNRNLSVSETETYSNTCVKTQVESDKQTNNEHVIEDLNKNQMSLTTKTTSASNDYPETEEKNNVIVESNAADNIGIGNILEKYKRLLKFNRNQANSQNLKEDINKNINQETKEKTEKVLPKITSCKKYKISDINNDKVAIPNLFTDIIGSKTENNSAKYLKSINEINIRSRIENSEENSYISNGDLAPKSPSPQNNKLAISVLQQLDMDNPDKEENSSNFNKNDLKFDCGADDFKLDESLLNPKTLLRTVEKEDSELIIPPPPEFSYSNSIYSPEKSGIATNYDDTEFMTESPKLSPNFNYTDDIMCENYLYQEFKEEELTPSKEIETWTLGPDTDSNECDSHEINLDLTAPFSAISYPSPFKISRNIRQSFTQPVTTVNRGRLQDFKFTQKDRLRKNTQHMSSLQRGIKKWPHVKRF